MEYSKKLLLVLLLFVILSAPSFALPGQKITSLVQWSANHPILTKLKYNANKYEPDERDYYSTAKFDEGEVSFEVWVNSQGNVIAENLDYRSSAKVLYFKRDNHNGVNLIKQIYGNDISNDFVKSKFVQVVKIPDTAGKIEFYRGLKYAYMVMNDDSNNIFTFSPILLKDLNKNINSWKNQKPSETY